MTKYKVTKDPHATLHPWHVVTPEGKIVWRSGSQDSANKVARMFARRRLLMERIRETGLTHYPHQ